MIQIIPNWHPLLVHFTIALLSVSVLLFATRVIIRRTALNEQITLVAYWNLWLGGAFTVLTIVAGWFAYNSVAHDTPSHAAMTDHRNWALATSAVFAAVIAWSVLQYRATKKPSIAFIAVGMVGLVLLMSTGWRGAEVVYRYGLGVVSLPKTDTHKHAHDDGDDHHDEPASQIMPMESTSQQEPMQQSVHKESEPHAHNEDGHAHEHVKEKKSTKHEHSHDDIDNTTPHSH